MSTLAIAASDNIVNFTFVVLRVVNSNEAISFLSVPCLLAISIFEQNTSISDRLMPCSNVFFDIEVLYELWFRAETEAEHGVCHVYEGKDCDC